MNPGEPTRIAYPELHIDGVVQVNQTAGVGNQSTNAVVLQLPGGAPP